MEGASAGQVPGERGVTRQTRRRIPRRLVADRGKGARQGPGIRVFGTVEHLPCRTVFDDPPGVHHRHPVTDRGQHRQVMADDQHRHRAGLRDAGEQVEDLGLHHDVERGRGLVGDQDARVARQGQRNHHPLLLSPRQLVRIGVGVPGRKPHLAEQVFHLARSGLGVGRLVVQQNGLGELLSDPLDRVERVQGPLEYHGRLAPPGRAQSAP